MEGVAEHLLKDRTRGGRAIDEFAAQHSAEIELVVAAGQNSLLLGVGGRQGRHNALQMGRSGLSGGVLILGLVRSAPHADLSVAPGLTRSPFDDVVAVLAEGVSSAP